MLEIIGQILCAMPLLKGVERLAHTLDRQRDITGGFILSFVGAIASILAALYFFNIISSQASGAREAMKKAQQNMEETSQSLDSSIRQFERDTGVKVP